MADRREERNAARRPRRGIAVDLGRELNTTLEIVDPEEPRLFTLRALDSPFQFTVRHELEPTDGGTRLTVTAEGDVPGVAAGFFQRRAEKQFRRDFERLKQILEG